MSESHGRESGERPTFLFFGYGSEYTLSPLFRFMSEHGDECLEVDLLTDPDPIARLRSLEGRRLVLVTSAHPLFDWQNFFFYRTHRPVVSVVHLIATLKPVASVFYPHDLKDPIKPEEMSYLPLFDLVLWPVGVPPRAVAASVRTEAVGWIKVENETGRPDGPVRHGTVFLPSGFQHYLNAGMDRLHADFRPLFEAGAAIKLPFWHESDAADDFLRARGVPVYPSWLNSIDVIRANDTIVTQALSSVSYEACGLGKSVVYIKDPVLDTADPEIELADAGAIAFVDSAASAAKVLSMSLPRNPVTLGPFDFARARRSIWDAYDAARPA